ncbi:MAG: phosphate ABC transporter permease subunit PstC [Nitrospirota bacterium]
MLKKRISFKKVSEQIIEIIIKFSGIFSIILVGLIFIFLLKEGISVFKVVNPLDFIFNKQWHPISDPPAFGIFSLILGSFFVTAGATIIALPLGIGSAIFIAEVAKGKTKEILKIGIEFSAAIPSVVIGFIGMVVVVPVVQKVFNLPTGLTALTGSILLSIMAMPTIVSIAEDAITAVPKRYREAALALGATRWQTIWRVVLRAASGGIVAACMLGIGRVIGETMVVMMVTGNAARIPHSLLEPVRTLTATIGAEMGETVQGGEHYFALFAIGIVLFIIAFIINFTADLFLHKEKV